MNPEYQKQLMEKYDLQIDKIVKLIRKEKAKNVLLQFPDGLKPIATLVAEKITKNTKAQIIIWLGTCFGACDLPNVESLKPKIDLVIQFGHSEWPYKGIKILRI